MSDLVQYLRKGASSSRGEYYLRNHAADRIEQLERQNQEIREALEEVVRISDRKHDAWDRAKAALSAADAKGREE